MAKETPEATGDRGATEDESIYCAVCGHRISERAARIEMLGNHEHVFVNPGGFQYRVGCFAAAPGAVPVGPTERAFSWFPGWDWQVTACAGCAAHLGWRYSLADGSFHGLILDRLR